MINVPVDWRKVLRYFIKTSQRAAKQSTIKKINRRYPYIHPGRKTSRQAQIAISIDQSGSVSDGDVEAFFGQLNELAKLADFTVIPFDDQVFEEKVFCGRRDNLMQEKECCVVVPVLMLPLIMLMNISLMVTLSLLICMRPNQRAANVNGCG